MDSSNKETPGLSLSASAEQPVAAPAGLPPELSNRGPERPVIDSEKAPAPAKQPAAPAITTIPLPLANPAPTMPPAYSPATLAQNAALLADDDSDLIEKEWVNKAKQLVERTRDDPYKQSEELTVFKADYIKKRYGKTIKVSH